MNDRSQEVVQSAGWPDCATLIRPDTKYRAGSRPSSTHVPYRKDSTMHRDCLTTVWRNRTCHVIAEEYSYKSEAYYTILAHELAGSQVCPSSRSVLDAYVVPVCLEHARKAGVRVADWNISQGYVPLPAIIYGINYFANTSEYGIVQNNQQSQEFVKHITNKGKYPFCYQRLMDSSTLYSCTAICGKTTEANVEITECARKIYDLFSIPLVRMNFIRNDGTYTLSSLAPTRYSRLSDKERSILCAFRDHQEFL